MPLQLSTIEEEIRKINDEEYASFEGFPADYQETAVRWAEAVYTYAQNLQPSSPLHGTAKGEFQTVLEKATGPKDYQAFLPTAFAKYASTVAGSMPGFTATPPATPINFSPVAAVGFAGGSSAECAKAMAGIIDAWFKTGTATNNNTGATINWS